MYIWRCACVALMLGAFICGYAMGIELIKEYPNVLISQDYGILNENDMILYTHKMAGTVPFHGGKKEHGYFYWQCFPRDHVSVTLEDTGNSPEEMVGSDTMADMSITVNVAPGVFHEYTMRALAPADLYEAMFHNWRSLMKNEKNICLGGQFGEHVHRIRSNGLKQEVYTWTFDELKTKKGCDSYFYEKCDAS